MRHKQCGYFETACYCKGCLFRHAHASKLRSVFLCVHVCWIVAKMLLHSLQGLEKGDYTAIAAVIFGQCLPREVVATQVVHAADLAFTGAAESLLWVRFVMFLVHTHTGVSGGWFHYIRVSVSFWARNSSLGKTAAMFSDQRYSEGGSVRGRTFKCPCPTTPLKIPC